MTELGKRGDRVSTEEQDACPPKHQPRQGDRRRNMKKTHLPSADQAKSDAESDQYSLAPPRDSSLKAISVAGSYLIASQISRSHSASNHASRSPTGRSRLVQGQRL